MCSINGGVSLNTKLKKSEISLIIHSGKKLKYRGPDEYGIYVNNNAILYSNRFSITGIKNGKMPVTNENKDIIIIFNGELYNYKILKKILIRKGHKFKTQSDGEVIAHAYEEWDTNCFNKFQGMFAIGILDNRKLQDKKLILARDRFGEKPLFYTKNKEKIFFSSEANYLLEFTKKEIDKNALAEYLSLKFSKDHIIKTIKRLPAGNYLLFSKRENKVKAYWIPKFKTNYLISFKEAKKEFKKRIEEVIKRMEPKEVKFGSFISGGIDSAFITKTLLNRIPLKERKLNIVSSGIKLKLEKKSNIKDSDYSSIEKLGNELGFTREFIKENKERLDYHEKEFSIKEFINNLGNMISHLPGGPVVSTSFPLYWFSAKEAKKNNLRVCFSGEGSDEILGGYRTSDPKEGYIWGQEIEGFKKITGLFEDKEIKSLIGITPNLKPIQNFINKSFKGKGKFEDQLFNRIRFLLRFVIDKHILEKGDGMTMASPLEIRMPFLDIKIVEFIYSLPKRFFIENENKKRILREIANEIGVSKSICLRPKQRTSLPYANIYFTSKYSQEILKILKEKNAKIRTIMNNQALDKILKDSQKNPQKIHALLILEIWLKKYY